MVKLNSRDPIPVSFSEILMEAAKKAVPHLEQDARHPEPLSRINYATELALKTNALQQFWKARKLSGTVNPVLPSLRGRHYRTTSKRRIVKEKSGFVLTYLSESLRIANPKLNLQPLVEPEEHQLIYKFMLGKLNTPAYLALAQSLNFLIIRGSYTEFTVLLNVHRLNAEVVRKAKLLSEHLQKLEIKIVSAFLYFDPSRSDFYFEAKISDGPWQLKKLFGPDLIHLKIKNRTYAYHPTAFCQVNESILPTFLEQAEKLLAPKNDFRLIDLYSGFGFFTLYLGHAYREAIGVDLGSVAIESAQKMAKADASTHCQFRSGRIQVANLPKLLPAKLPGKQEVLLLDPPRQGTEQGVIAALAARKPARVLHIFCDMNTLPSGVNEWSQSGYAVSEVVPLDMFPGTDNLEVMVLFLPV